jgi:midasin (ATPase involved in ribosome maturation)
MNIKTFTAVSRILNPHHTILLRADHGVGKSSVVRQIAYDIGLPLIDRRLAQLADGDIVGLPKIDEETNSSRFCPPDWYMRAVNEPVVLFLDELNRGTPEIMAAAFQIVLDREMNGYKLHEGTRVFAAINTAEGGYNVNDMDAALLDRFWVVDLEPTVEDVLEYGARPREAHGGGFHPSVLEYIRTNPSCIKPNSKDPTSVQPTPRSWDRFNLTTTSAKLLDADFKKDTASEQLVYDIATGYIGLDLARNFCAFLKTREQLLSAEDVLHRFDKNKKRIKDLGSDIANELCDKIVDHFASIRFVYADTALLETVTTNYAKFFDLLDDERKFQFYVKTIQRWLQLELTQDEVMPFASALHPKVGQEFLRIITAMAEAGVTSSQK